MGGGAREVTNVDGTRRRGAVPWTYVFSLYYAYADDVLSCLLFFVFLSVLCFISLICALVVFYVWRCCTFLPSPLVLLPVFLSFF